MNPGDQLSISDENVSDGSPHPLMLSPVLEVLFEKCDYETIKINRFVCKTWLSVSASFFRKKSILNFLNMYPETYIEIRESLAENPNFLPVNVALTLSPFGESHNSSNVSPSAVCEECIFPFGTEIESLKFYAWDSTSDRLKASLLAQVLQTPNRLRSLEVSLLPKEVSSSPLFPQPWKSYPPLPYLTSLVMYGKLECEPEFVDNFLSAMPLVNSISINCCSEEFLDVFTESLSSVQLKNLSHLKFNFVQNFNSSHITNIEKAKLRLQTAHIAQRSMLLLFDDYENLLGQLSPTVQDVKLTCCTRLVNHEQFLRMPSMPNLKRLTVQCWGILRIWNLNFIRNTPVLETLILERRGLFAQLRRPPEKWHCFTEERTIKQHLPLTELTLPAIPLLFIHPDSLANVLFKFSALKKLSICANDDCLEGIYQNSPQLEELTIAEYSRITDDGITGLVSGENGAMAECYNIRLGISTLKQLRRLEVDGFWGSITDFSVKYGLLHLRKLESVMLRGCNISEWSVQALQHVELAVIGHDAFHVYEEDPVNDIGID